MPRSDPEFRISGERTGLVKKGFVGADDMTLAGERGFRLYPMYRIQNALRKKISDDDNNNNKKRYRSSVEQNKKDPGGIIEPTSEHYWKSLLLAITVVFAQQMA